MHRALSIVLLSALPLAACATPKAQVRDGLMDAGLSRKQSSCMAERMVDKLSLLQLRRLSSLGNFSEEKVKAMSVERFLHNVRSLKDPEILAVTTKAALGCAISG